MRLRYLSLAAAVAAAVLCSPPSAGAQTLINLAFSMSVSDDTGAPVLWYPCRTLSVEITGISYAQSARAATGPHGTCAATILAPASGPLSISVGVFPNLRCAASPAPPGIPIPARPAGAAGPIPLEVRFACDAGTLARTLRAHGVSLERPPAPAAARLLEQRVMLPGGPPQRLTRTVSMVPKSTGTIQFDYWDRGGVCDDDAVYAGFHSNVYTFYQIIENTMYADDRGVGVGFDDGTWSGVLCGATNAFVWEGWTLFDLTPIAATRGEFARATLVVENGVIGWSNRSYTTLSQSCLHDVIAATRDYYASPGVDSHAADGWTQMPGHVALPAFAQPMPLAHLTAGPQQYSTIADVTDIVRAWLSGARPNHGFVFVEGPKPSTFPRDNEYCYQVLNPIHLNITP